MWPDNELQRALQNEVHVIIGYKQINQKLNKADSLRIRLIYSLKLQLLDILTSTLNLKM